MSIFFEKAIYFDTLDSTNDYLIKLYKEFSIKTNLVVVSNDQKKGRGRRNKNWFSNKKSLTFSFSVQLDNEISSWGLNMAISLSLIQALNDVGIKSMIKYPNDIIVDNKKIAGILTEVILAKNKKYCIVGVGLNVNNTSFPREITNAVSIKELVFRSISKEALLKSILFNLNSFIKKRFLKKYYMLALYGSQEYVSCRYQGNFISVKILNITDKGILTISPKNSSILTVSDLDLKFLLN